MRSALRARLPFLIDSGYATLTAGSAALLLVLLTIAGRFLSVPDYGRFRYALALTTIVETLMDLGLSQVTVRTVARDKASADRVFPQVLGLKIVWVGVGLAVLGVLAPILRTDPVIVKLCYALGLSSAVRSYLLTARGLLQGLHRFDLEALAVVSDRVLLLVIGGLALWAGYGLTGLAAAFVGSRLLMLGAMQFLLRRVIGDVRPAFDRVMWRDIQSAALPLGFFMIALNTYSYVDTVILGLMRSDTEIGWYAASYSVYEGLTYAPSILAAVLTPRLSSLFTHDRAAHRTLLTRALLTSVALAVLLGGLATLAATPIITLLFGSRYAPAAPPLQILAAGSVFVFATWILHAAAISTNLDRRLLLTTGIGLGANIALNVALIPRYGINGAAWATVAAEGLTVLLLIVQIERRLRRP
jgi:O-antigen/teichoic acid export membrane protein